MDLSKSEDKETYVCGRQMLEDSTIASVDGAHILDRRPPRVILRTGSPQHVKRISLRRAPRTKLKSASVPSRKHGIKPISPTRALWASPITVSTTAQREPGKGSMKINPKPTTPRTPKKTNSRQYSILNLLALRPGGPAVREWSSLNGLMGRPPTRKDLSNRLRAIQKDPLYLPNKPIFRSGMEGRPSKLPLQEARNQLQKCADIVLRPGYTDKCKEKSVPESPSKESGFLRKSISDSKAVVNWGLNEEVNLTTSSCYSPLQTPVENRVPTQNRLRSQVVRADELESRIKSSLTRRKSQRSSESPRKLNSVKWDPAVIEYGPVVTSDQSIDSLKKGTTAVVPEHESSKDEPSPIPLSSEPKNVPKTNKNVAHEFMKSLTTLKKGDRRKALQLLEALRNVDSDDSSDSDTIIVTERPKSRSIKKPIRTVLNPEAPEFKKPSILLIGTAQNQSLSLHGQQSLHIPRKRPHIPVQNDSLKEPIWVKKDSLLPRATTPDCYKGRSDDSHYSYTDNLLGLQFPAVHIPQYSQLYAMSELSQLPHSGPEMFLGLPNPYRTSCLPMYDFQPLVLNHQACVNPELPIIDIVTGRIPSESETGREAFAHALPAEMQKLVNQFMKHFPLTGKIKAAPPVSVRSRHAATIQQRLEYLLMEQKEKKWRDQQSSRCATRVTSLSPSSKISRTFSHHERKPLVEIRNNSSSENWDKLAERGTIEDCD